MRTAGMTVTDLNTKGATALNDAQLKALIVGKAFWMRNNVTGEQFSQNFTVDGQTIVFRVGYDADTPSGFGNVAQDGYAGDDQSPTRSRAASSSLSSQQEPYAFTFYKLGDTVLRRAQQRVRLCQLRDHSGAADRGEPADRDVEPVLDRARADGAAAERRSCRFSSRR